MLSRGLSRCFVLTLVVAGYFTLVSAQQSAQPPAEPVKKARIEGIVTSSAGPPIARAKLTLQGPAAQANPPANGQAGATGLPTATTYSATSDATGKFAIENVEPGNAYRLTAEKAGFNNTGYGARSSNSNPVAIRLGRGQELKGVALVMTPQAVISGKITDVNGDPVQSARVSLMRRAYQRGVRTMATSSTATTNDQGEYRIANLIAGHYILYASDSITARILSQDAPPVSNLPTYYPNSPDMQGAAPIDLTAGAEQRGIDIQFRTGKTFAIRGKAVNSETGEVVTTTVRMTPKGDGSNDLVANALQNILTRRNPDGTFEIRNLTPGIYVLQNQNSTALINGVQAPKLVGRMEVTIADKDVDGVILPLDRGATVTGTLKLENGDVKTLVNNSSVPGPSAATLAAAATLGVTLAVPGRTVTLAVAQGTGTSPGGTINPDGTFRIELISPDKYFVNIPLPSGYYVKTASFGGTDVVHNPLDLSSGSGGEIQILVSDKAGTITGQVANDKGEMQSNVGVTLWSSVPEGGSPTNGVRFAFTDANGNFQFANLAPGEYRAAAWEDIDRQLALVRDFLSQFNGNAEKAKLAESGSVALNLKLIPVDKIKAAEGKLP